MNFLSSQFRVNSRPDTHFGISGGAMYLPRPADHAPALDQHEGDGEGEDEYPETEEEPELEESVRSHVIRKAKSGFKNIVDKSGEAFMSNILPVLIDQIIGRILTRLTGPKAREGEPGEVVKGGARAINQMGKRHNTILPVGQVQKALRRLRPDNAHQIHREIMKLGRSRR